nr:hypothetical protein GCM10020092_050750 [Actinoplanes digitatis]
MDESGGACGLRAFWVRLVGARGGVLGVSAAELAKAPSVALGQAPCAVSFVLAAELVALGGIVAGCGAVTHSGQLTGGEELKLPHVFIIPERPPIVLFFDPLSIMPTYRRPALGEESISDLVSVVGEARMH